MEARELRIGNYIRYKGTIIPVTAVYIGQPTLKDAEPIQLTPEILGAAGFTDEQGNFKKGPLFISYWVGEGFIFWPDEMDEDNIMKIISLHQLQNLYFALTGEELTVNLKETKEAVLIWNHLAQITTGL